MFERKTYIQRRQTLMRTLSGGVVLLLGNDHSPMNYRDNMYPFRQDSTFLYYVGLDHPQLAALIDLDEGRCTIYGRTPTVDDVIWSGPQPTLAELAQAVGADDVQETEALDAAVTRVLATGRRLHFLAPYRGDTQLRLESLLSLRSGAAAHRASMDLTRAVIAQRSVKEEQEIEQIEIALQTTLDMHVCGMEVTQPGVVEREMVGLIEGLAISGGGRLAFPCIFTRRGEVLHNHTYANELQAGDLVVHDSGAASPKHYASDITRTIPVGQRFTERQRAIYSAVLAAQEDAIKVVKPGVRFIDVHLTAARTLTQHLQALNIMQGDTDESVAAGAHALFFPHGLGHMTGLDVHDMENLGEDLVGYDSETTRATKFGLRGLRFGKVLQPAYVMTVEPGCYFIGPLIDQWRAAGTQAAFINYEETDHWRSFGGVRIEDDVLVTDDGYRVLGPGIPKAPEEVEALVMGDQDEI